MYEDKSLQVDRNTDSHDCRYVDVSTVDGDTSKAIYKAVQAKGAEFLEVTSLPRQCFEC